MSPEQSPNKIPYGLGYEDILIKPAQSDVSAEDLKTDSRLTAKTRLRYPVISAAMPAVTGPDMAIALGMAGALGVLHRFQSIEAQVADLERVKSHISGFIRPPKVIMPGAKLQEASDIMDEYDLPVLPVVDSQSQKVIGVINQKVLRSNDNHSKMVVEVMADTASAKERSNQTEHYYRQAFEMNQAAYLVLVDEAGRCTGLIVANDFKDKEDTTHATKDPQGRLLAAAAIGLREGEQGRAEALLKAGADILILETLNAHTKAVTKMVTRLRRIQVDHGFQVIAGNVATKEGARALIEAGADAVKVGIGSGSLARTTAMAGVGIPQISALQAVSKECAMHNIPVIADGGIRSAGDIAKALAAGADTVMIGALLAGSDEAPGERKHHQGYDYKLYKGARQPDPTRVTDHGDSRYVPVTGPVAADLDGLMNGLKLAMQYTGITTVDQFREKVEFIRIRPVS